MIRQSVSHFGGSDCLADRIAAWTFTSRLGGEGLGRSRLGDGRNRRDRLQDLGSDLVGVALRVRAAIFQIAFVAVVGERVRNADRSAAVGDTIGEVADCSGLVLAGQPQMVIRSIDSDVVLAGPLER